MYSKTIIVNCLNDFTHCMACYKCMVLFPWAGESIQYCSKVSWQSRLETRFSILEVFENRESSFEDRVSSEFFYNPKRVCCFDLRDFNRPPKRKQTLTAKKYVLPYEIRLTWKNFNLRSVMLSLSAEIFASAWVLIFLSALPHGMVSHARGRAMRIVFS